MTSRTTSRALPLLACATAVLAAAGCSGGTPGAVSTAPLPAAGAPSAAPSAVPSAAPTAVPSAVPSATGTACPAPPAGLRGWPAGVPLDLPIPPGAVMGTSSVQPGGITVVRFSTADSLRDGVLHLVRTLGPAGFTLGRGDSEAGEADAPFTRADLRGVYRMTVRGPCRTDWVLAVTIAPDTGTPLLPTPTESAAPLPFG